MYIGLRVTQNIINHNLKEIIMTTSNVNSVEMVNNSVESNNTIMGNIEELTKVFEQEEKELNRLIKGNRNEAVIAAQQKVVDEAKTQMEQAKEFERISKEKAVNSSFTFSVVDDETGARTEQQKNFKSTGDSITGWQLLNLLNGSVKSSYIDNFLERNLNCTEFVQGIQRAKLGDSEYAWFLG